MQDMYQEKLCAGSPVSNSSTVFDLPYTTNNFATSPPVDLVPSCHDTPCHSRRKVFASLRHARASPSRRAQVSSLLLCTVSKITPRPILNQIQRSTAIDLPSQREFSMLGRPSSSFRLLSPMLQASASLGRVDRSRRRSLARTFPWRARSRLDMHTNSSSLCAYDNTDVKDASRWQYANASPSLAIKASKECMGRLPITPKSGSLDWDITTIIDDGYHSPDTQRHGFDLTDFVNLTPSPLKIE